MAVVLVVGMLLGGVSVLSGFILAQRLDRAQIRRRWRAWARSLRGNN